MENELDIMKEPMQLSEVFVKSGMFPDVKSQAQGVVKILAGKELGLTAFQSMSGIYFVGGRLALQANVMSGLVRRSKRYDYSVKTITDDNCIIEFSDVSEKEQPKLLGTSTFGKTEAAKAGLINKDNYKNYPRNMYFARALANGARWFCPDAIMGYHSIEELQDAGEEATLNKTTVTIDVNAEAKDGDKIAKA